MRIDTKYKEKRVLSQILPFRNLVFPDANYRIHDSSCTGYFTGQVGRMSAHEVLYKVFT